MKSIKVEHLSKIYDVSHAEERTIGFRELITQQIGSLFSKKEQSKKFYALNDVSFDVEQGEVLGVIGKNGSGKSTLLKILSRITAPTSGKVTIHGRVASLLEVGTGFHEELTGRENIFMSGIILGMKRWEIYKHFDEIVSFAGVEQFIDTPVKKYSSGMRLRLAFSVAAHLQAEILLIDEVLAVGDYEFEKKCMGVMGDIQKSGRTILFVSHNMEFIKRLCTRLILLEHGKIKQIGSTFDVIDSYFGYINNVRSKLFFDDTIHQPDKIIIIYLMECLNVLEKGMLYLEESLCIKTVYEIKESQTFLFVNLCFYNEKGILLFTAFEAYSHQIQGKRRDVGVYESFCYVPSHIFNEGQVSVSLLITNTGTAEKQSEDNLIFQLDGGNIFFC